MYSALHAICSAVPVMVHQEFRSGEFRIATLTTPAAEAATTAPISTALPRSLVHACGLAGALRWGAVLFGEGPRGPRRRSVVGVCACWPDHIVVGRLIVSSSPLMLPPYLQVTSQGLRSSSAPAVHCFTLTCDCCHVGFIEVAAYWPRIALAFSRLQLPAVTQQAGAHSVRPHMNQICVMRFPCGSGFLYRTALPAPCNTS